MKHYLSRLEASVKAHWNDKALCTWKGESFTFGQMAGYIEKFHILFAAAGVEKMDKVAICAKNSARWGISFLSVNTYGAVAVPILADFHPESVNALVDHSESIVLITDNDIWKKLDIDRMPALRGVISAADFSLLHCRDRKLQKAMDTLEDLFMKKFPHGFSPDDVSYPAGNDGDLALINYTSGTTSAPKGVMLRYECISSNVEFGLKRIPVSPGDTLVSMLPPAHMYGMAFEFLYPLCGGATVYFLGKTPTPSLLLGAMASVRPYLIITVPLVMEKIFRNSIQPVISRPVMKALLHLPGIRRVILNKIRAKLLGAFGGNVKMIIMGGAPLNPEVEEWFRRIGLPYTVGYGMTECAPLLGYEDCGRFVARSCGKCVDRCEVRIDSDDPEHVPGEIQARGVNVMSGYYRNPEATEAAFTPDGWLRTGDLGVIDSDGNIFIRGRSKNMILSSNGQNIYPEEVEAVVNSQPYVVESVVVDRESRLVALTYIDREKAESDGLDAASVAAAVQAASNKALPSYSRISKVEIVDEPFEKTPKMSIRRFLYK